MSVRFASTVHGDGDNGFIAMIVAADRAAGAAAFIGDGTNGEEGVALRDVTEAVGRALDLPVTSITAQEAGADFGFLAHFLASDMPA